VRVMFSTSFRLKFNCFSSARAAMLIIVSLAWNHLVVASLRHSDKEFIVSAALARGRTSERRIRVRARARRRLSLRREPRRSRRQTRIVRVRTGVLTQRHHTGRSRRSRGIAHRTHSWAQRTVRDRSRSRQSNRIRRPSTARDDSIANPVLLPLLAHVLRREASRQRRLTRRTLLNIMFPALHQTASMKHVSARQPGDEFHFIWIIARLRPRSIQRALTHRAIALTVRIPRRLHAPRGFHHQSSSAARRLGRGEQQPVPNRIRQHFRRLLARRAPDRRSRERR